MVNDTFLPKWVFLGFLLGSSRCAGATATVASRPVAGALLQNLRTSYHLVCDDISTEPESRGQERGPTPGSTGEKLLGDRRAPTATLCQGKPLHRSEGPKN